MRGLIYLSLFGVVIWGAVALFEQYGSTPLIVEHKVSLLVGIALLLVFSLSLWGAGDVKLGQGLKAIGAWLIIGAVLGMVYLNLDRFRQEFHPARPRIEGDIVTVQRSRDRQFHSVVSINDHKLHMMIDTGASMVALPYEVAEKIGLNPEQLIFYRTVNTANGTAKDAPVRLERVQIGNIVLENVAAGIAEPGNLSTPLLGMSFLNRLNTVQFSGNQLVLIP